MPAIFISYRKKDAGGHVGHLRSDLERSYGRRAVFTDFDSIDPGTPWMERIEEALSSSDIALIVIGENWAASELDPDGDSKRMRRIDDKEDVLRKEVSAALRRPDVKVVPILVEDAQPLKATDLPEDLSDLSKLHVCSLRNSDWDADFARIRRTIEATSGDNAFRRYVAKARIAAGRHKAAIATLAVTLAAVLAIALTLGPSEGSDEGCENISIPQDVRDRLSPAAGTREEAKSESVYYGTCESQSWAIAEFPEIPSTLFVQEGFGWRRLGATPAVKCARVPEELLDEWKQNDC